MAMPRKPWRPASVKTSRGTMPAASQVSRFGTTSFSSQARKLARSASCSASKSVLSIEGQRYFWCEGVRSGDMRIGVLAERSAGERRVALVPDGAKRLIKTDLEVIVESGAGQEAGYPDSA